MSVANRLTYLDEVLCELNKQWPNNRIVNIVCHGHSVPAGYFATPFIDTFHAYPHLLHRILKERFPFACLNVIVTSIGGENSLSGSKRFNEDVLCHKPDVLTIDYALNDRGIELEKSKSYWSDMIENALKKNIKVIVLTPSWEKSYFEQNENWRKLVLHAEQVRSLADQYNIGLSDSFNAFKSYVDGGGDLTDLLSHVNHPNRKGHDLIANELARWFMAK
jgi:lysophospholipase L1-like esterase